MAYYDHSSLYSFSYRSEKKTQLTAFRVSVYTIELIFFLMNLRNGVYKSVWVVFFLVIVNASNAQQQTAFGIKAGLNLTNLKVSDPDASYDSRSGFHAGFFVREKFSKVAIQPEFLISTLSTDVSSSTLGDWQDRFTYLNIPIMVRFYIVDGLNFHAGPQFGFLLDGDRQYSGPLGQGSEDIKDYYKNSDVSISLGGGWDFPFGMNVDVRYNVGVQDINEASGGEEAKSRVFQVSVGWNFLK